MSITINENEPAAKTGAAPSMAGRRLEDLPDLMTPQELSSYLQIPVRTLYYWNAHDEGPTPEKYGKHLRYPKENVLTWRRGVDRR